MTTYEDTTVEADPRQVRGKLIAEMDRIEQQRSGKYRVHSQFGNGWYTVSMKLQSCTCPDYEERQSRCKHVWAVEYHEERVMKYRDTTVTEVRKRTYTRNWSDYNASQTEEKARVMSLLAEACAGIAQPHQSNGRPRLSLADMTFASILKVYSGMSSRRFISDLRDAQDAGYIERVPHFNSISNTLADEALTPILQSLVSLTAAPLRSIERDFAIDSSGFSTQQYMRWVEHKWGNSDSGRYREWMKCHLTVGVLTKIVTAVEVTDWRGADSPQFPVLVERTASAFPVREVSADKAYLSRANLESVVRVGATPFIPFKSTTVVPTEDSVWGRMYHWIALNRDTFLTNYHKRSNVESAFSMIKAKFGGSVRGKCETSQRNEVLAKVVCHNLSVLVHAHRSYGVQPQFGPEFRAASGEARAEVLLF